MLAQVDQEIASKNKDGFIYSIQNTDIFSGIRFFIHFLLMSQFYSVY